MLAVSRKALFALSIFYFFSYPEVDPDLWGHLFFGREILERGGLPDRNTYSYTASQFPWINHEWLSEILFYAIFALSGSSGLILLKVAVGAGIVWLLRRLIRERRVPALPETLALVWTMALLSAGFTVRPQIFTYLLFAIFIYLFYQQRENIGLKVAVFPFLTILWVNLHGGFVVGLGTLGLFSLWTLFSEKVSGAPARVALLRFFALLLSLLASWVNPYGFDLLRFLAEDLFLPRPITEWQPVPWNSLSFLEFKLALVLIVVVFLKGGSWRRLDLVLAFLAAFFAVQHQRHIPLFAIAAAPLLASELQTIYEWVKDRARPRFLTSALVAAVIYQLLALGRIHFHHRLELVVNPGEYPTQAADFLMRNQIQGNLAVPFEWGEYLIWKLYPGVRVSIDGRFTTAYPAEVLRDNWEWMAGGKGWKRLLDHYPTDIALASRQHPVAGLLWKDPEWVYIYSDPVAFIFVRKTASQEELLSRFRKRELLSPERPPIHFPG